MGAQEFAFDNLDWQAFAKSICDLLSARKAAQQKNLESSLKAPITEFIEKGLGGVVQTEVPHPAFKDLTKKPRRRIDFSIPSAKTELIIEGKFLPEIRATPAKYSHDLVKDIFRLAFINFSNGQTVSADFADKVEARSKPKCIFLLARPAAFPAGGPRATQAWRHLFDKFLPKEGTVTIKPKEMRSDWNMFWHIQKNLSHLPLCDTNVNSLAFAQTDSYIVSCWDVAPVTPSDSSEGTSFKKIGDRIELSINGFGGAYCGACSKRLYKILGMELNRSIAKIKPCLKSPSLHRTILDGKSKPKDNVWYPICPCCDAYALGAELTEGYTLRDSDGRLIRFSMEMAT